MKEIVENRPILMAMAFLCLAVIFMGLFDRDLWTPDEPRVAAISLEMSRTGDFVVPQLAGEPFIEKPPLYYAVSAFFINALGKYVGNTQAIRLVTALFGVATLLMTFLLARLFYGTTSGIVAAALLATMLGFVKSFHWIRVDAALSFFVIASVYAFAEVYFEKRAWFCPLGGLFTACAFLSKGLIGPILIAVPFSGLLVLWLTDLRKNGFSKKDFFVLHYLLCLFVFVLLSGSWIYLFRLRAGQQLWHDWFWTNQVGRMTGATTALGHIRTGKPFYYLVQLAADSSPWFPLIAAWAGIFIYNLVKRRPLSKQDIFLFTWGAGCIFLLSLSATKRGIYLLPAFPAFALMCIPAIEAIRSSRFFKLYFLVWLWLCALSLGLFTLVPLGAQFLGGKIPAQTLRFLNTFSIRYILCGVCFIICLRMIFSFLKARQSIAPVIIASALMYIGLWAVPMKAVDTVKSMRSDIQSFAARIPQNQRPRIAGYTFNETMLGCFYYYSDWAVPQIKDTGRINRIIAGRDHQFDSIIINRDRPWPDVMKFINKTLAIPWRLIEKEYTGDPKHGRGVFWITGIKDS